MQFCRSEAQYVPHWTQGHNFSLETLAETLFSTKGCTLSLTHGPFLHLQSQDKSFYHLSVSLFIRTSSSSVSFDIWNLKVLGLCHSLPKLCYQLYGCISARELWMGTKWYGWRGSAGEHVAGARITDSSVSHGKEKDKWDGPRSLSWWVWIFYVTENGACQINEV